MLLTTTNAIEGKEITLYIGIVSGEMFIEANALNRPSELFTNKR